MTRVPAVLMSRLREFITDRMALWFPEERADELERKICSAAQELGFEDVQTCIEWLLSSPLTGNQIATVAGYLTIGETYFFREEKTFEILEEQVLPELIRSRRRQNQQLRIWSAGCCTGEEPYSVAILINRLIPDIDNWNITILATDINAEFLQKASQGVYKNWSFRGRPPGFKDTYFRAAEHGRFQILPRIKRLVTFGFLNLADDSYPSPLNNTNAMDIVLCRNVLMYFAPEKVEEVVERFFLSLMDGGLLVVGLCEAGGGLGPRFGRAVFRGVPLFRKDGEGIRTRATLPPFRPAIEHRPFKHAREPEASFPGSPASVSKAKAEAASPEKSRKARARAKPEEKETTEAGRTPFEEALSLYEQGRYLPAKDVLSKAISDGNSRVKAMALLARVEANLGNLSQAVTWCDKTIAGDKLDSGIRYLRAAILQEKGEFDEAIRALRSALYLDSDFVLAHFALGNISRRLGKHREARKHFQNALSLLQDYPQEDIVPHSDGMTAGRLLEIVASTEEMEAAV